MVIEFINDQEWGIDKTLFNPVIDRVNGVMDLADGVLNVVFVNDKYITALNSTYRDKNTVTDVLSFNYQHEMDHGNLIGEIYISVDTAKRQAEEHKHDLQDELNKLLVHGFLHIHGYDHENDDDYAVMSALEDRILLG